MLLVSAAVIYTCTTLSLKLKFKYPAIDCKIVDNDYGPTNDNMNMTLADNYE